MGSALSHGPPASRQQAGDRAGGVVPPVVVAEDHLARSVAGGPAAVADVLAGVQGRGGRGVAQAVGPDVQSPSVRVRPGPFPHIDRGRTSDASGATFSHHSVAKAIVSVRFRHGVLVVRGP
jgi:hypothetical protein